VVLPQIDYVAGRMPGNGPHVKVQSGGRVDVALIHRRVGGWTDEREPKSPERFNRASVSFGASPGRSPEGNWAIAS